MPLTHCYLKNFSFGFSFSDMSSSSGHLCCVTNLPVISYLRKQPFVFLQTFIFCSHWFMVFCQHPHSSVSQLTTSLSVFFFFLKVPCINFRSLAFCGRNSHLTFSRWGFQLQKPEDLSSFQLVLTCSFQGNEKTSS